MRRWICWLVIALITTPVSGQDLVPAATGTNGGEGVTRPSQLPSLVRKKTRCDPAKVGCFTREQEARFVEIARDRERCNKNLTDCRMDSRVKAETWSVGTVILIAGVALLAGVLVGGGTVLLVK